MTFKENLLTKLRIDSLANKVRSDIAPAGNIGGKIDKDTMRELLELSPFRLQKERDLELYLLGESAPYEIIVLDNELPLYNTTVHDVAVRKSATVKEMINIGNVFKILSDKDVKVAKRAETLEKVRESALEGLDLSHTEADIEAIAQEGKVALEMKDGAGVREALTLFQELLGLVPAPGVFGVADHEIFGKVVGGQDKESQDKESQGKERLMAPLLLYNSDSLALKLLEGPLDSGKKEDVESVRRVALSKESPLLEGTDVFNYLKKEVVKKTG